MRCEIDGVVTETGGEVSFIYMDGLDRKKIQGVLREKFETVGKEEFISVRIYGVMGDRCFYVNNIICGSFSNVGVKTS